MLKMNDVQFHCTLCQALLLLTVTLINARPPPTSLQPIPVHMPADNSQLPLPGNLNGGVEFPDPDQKPLENPNLFEGDLLISSEEIELYYGKQSDIVTHVLISLNQ